jgi:mono/diheme cytochrome c family protein
MMKNALKWMGLIVGGLLIVVVIAAVGLSVAGGARLSKRHDIQAENITIPADEAALARGEHLVQVACTSCHGADLSGQPMLDEPPIGAIYSANLTGLADTHSDADLLRAIRHGVDMDGRQLIIMPAEVFIHFSEEDLGAIIAYLKTIPRQGNERPEPELALVGRMMMGAGLFGNAFPAEYIDHDLPFPEMPAVGANEAYGQYLAGLCTSCHGANLAGGQPGEPDSPPAPNLTPGGELQGWTEEDFITAMRSGVTPNGRQLDPMFMPWQSVGKLDDEELRGLWLYLESLAPQQTAVE